MEERKEYRILFLVDVYPNHGGVVTVTESLGQIFKARGHKVYLLSLGRNEKIIASSHIFEAAETMPQATHFETDANKVYLLSFVQKHKIEIVINQALVSSADCYLNPQIKVINVTHSVPFWELEDIRYSITRERIVQAKGVGKKISLWRKRLLNRLWPQRKKGFIRHHYEQHLQNGAAFVCLTKEYCDVFSAEFPAYKEKLIAIPNPLQKRPFIEKIDKEKIVLYVGRLSHFDKRPDRLLKIWKEVEGIDDQGWKLVVIGDGEQRGFLETYVKKNHLQRVYFEGYQDPSPYYEKASLLALTSSIEGFPMVLLEAQQQGVVPIAYNCTAGVSALLSGGETGSLISCFKQSRFVKELLSLMQDEQKREQLSLKGKDFILQYHPENIAQEWELFFDQITQQPQNSQ